MKAPCPGAWFFFFLGVKFGQTKNKSSARPPKSPAAINHSPFVCGKPGFHARQAAAVPGPCQLHYRGWLHAWLTTCGQCAVCQTNGCATFFEPFRGRYGSDICLPSRLAGEARRGTVHHVND